MRSLTRFEVRWARDAFEAIFPFPRGIGSFDVEAYLTHMMRSVPLEPALGVRLAIWIVALAPLFVLGRFVTIHGLLPQDRETLVVRLASSTSYPVRQLVLLLKTLGAILYASDASVRERLFGFGEDVAPLRKKADDALLPPAEPDSERKHVIVRTA